MLCDILKKQGDKMIYLDYSATTPTNDDVLEHFCKINKSFFANPNSNYKIGTMANKEINNSTNKIKEILKLRDHEIIYTSGSSESNNLAIKGSVLRNKSAHIITTNFEHSSVIAPINYLQIHGFEVDIVDNNNKGIIEIEALEKLIKTNTTLISMTAVNSEIGIIEPFEEIGAYLKEKYPNIIFHVDLTQLITKKKIDLTNIDLASISAHKFYGLKGIGCLIKRKNLKLEPQIQGGKSTTIYRSGTPPTSLISSLAKSLELAYQDIEEKYNYVNDLSKYLKGKLANIPNLKINSTDNCLPHIINFSLIGKDPNQVQKYLADREIYISTKTACSSDTAMSNSVYSLTKDKERASSSLRVSISHLTTKEEIDIFIEKLKELR